MVIDERTVVLKDGRLCLIRTAGTADAAALIDLMRRTSAESTYLINNPDEIAVSEAAEIAYLERMRASACDVQLVAFVGESLVAAGACLRRSERRKLAHRTEIGLSVRKHVWGLGLGRAMLAALIGTAASLGFEQVELGVFSANERALRLYERVGFVTVGCLPRAAKLDDGTYYDEYRMVLTLPASAKTW